MQRYIIKQYITKYNKDTLVAKDEFPYYNKWVVLVRHSTYLGGAIENLYSPNEKDALLFETDLDAQKYIDNYLGKDSDCYQSRIETQEVADDDRRTVWKSNPEIEELEKKLIKLREELAELEKGE